MGHAASSAHQRGGCHSGTLSEYCLLLAQEASFAVLFYTDSTVSVNSKEPDWDVLLAVHTKGEAVTVVRSEYCLLLAQETSNCSAIKLLAAE